MNTLKKYSRYQVNFKVFITNLISFFCGSYFHYWVVAELENNINIYHAMKIQEPTGKNLSVRFQEDKHPTKTLTVSVSNNHPG